MLRPLRRASSAPSSFCSAPDRFGRVALRCLLSLGLCLASGCSTDAPSRGASSATATDTSRAGESSSPKDESPLVVFLGDSLTAGYGLDEAQAYPALVAERLRADGKALRVVNAGVSGDTTAGGLARVDWVLRQHPDVVVVALGANDGLRGAPVESVEENLRQIVRRVAAAGARPILVGMRMPPNYGPVYERDFAALFPRLAEELDVPLIPFLLEGVGGRRELNLPDGVHPNPAGQRILAETVAPYVASVLEELGS